MTVHAVFIFLSPEGDPAIHRSEVDAGKVKLSTHAVKNYADACSLAKQLAENGTVAIELCGGFGTQGVAAVEQAVRGRAIVGVVRFDHHPGLAHVSGDTVFG